jgi:hypothetical protein
MLSKHMLWVEKNVHVVEGGIPDPPQNFAPQMCFFEPEAVHFYFAVARIGPGHAWRGTFHGKGCCRQGRQCYLELSGKPFNE